MFNLGLSEILVIAVVLIIVVGPERLPLVMKKVGNALRTVRQASREIQTTVGLDELWREDVLQTPPPRPRVPPNGAVTRSAELGPSAAAAASTTQAATDAAAPTADTPAGSAPAPRNDALEEAAAASPPAPGDIKGES